MGLLREYDFYSAFTANLIGVLRGRIHGAYKRSLNTYCRSRLTNAARDQDSELRAAAASVLLVNNSITWARTKYNVLWKKHWWARSELIRYVQKDTYVDFVRDDNPRTGDPSELRLCEQWTATAKSVFLFDVQGSVAKSTHSGLPWLLWLREMPGSRSHVHFWPFDGFDVPEGKSVIAEAYPALYKRRFPKGDRSSDEHDAWSIAAWVQEADHRGTLDRYFEPPLTLPERKQAELEGWILGVW